MSYRMCLNNMYRRSDLLHGITASYRCGGTGSWMRARGRQHNNNGVCACVRASTGPARLSDVDARRRQDAGGTRRDLTIGCAVLGA